MNRNARVALGLACLFSVYTVYLFLELASAALSKPFEQYYVFPFVAVHLMTVFSFWTNLVSLCTLVFWVFWFVQFVRDR